MYKCRNCGHIFDEGEQKTRFERHNDYYTEPINICPVCGSDNFDTCVYCRVCEAEHFRDELNNKGICAECIEAFIADNASNERTCFDIGAKDKTPVEINSFLLNYWGGIVNIERHLLDYISGIQELFKQDFSQYLKNSDEDIISDMALNERR